MMSNKNVRVSVITYLWNFAHEIPFEFQLTILGRLNQTKAWKGKER